LATAVAGCRCVDGGEVYLAGNRLRGAQLRPFLTPADRTSMKPLKTVDSDSALAYHPAKAGC